MKPLNILIMFFTGVIFCSCQSQKLSLQEISTEKLYQISMEHPSKVAIFQFDDCCGAGLGTFRRNCPEFMEFWSRNDCAAVLFDEYSKLDPLAVDPNWTLLQTGEFSWSILYIEYFLAQEYIINKLNDYPPVFFD